MLKTYLSATKNYDLTNQKNYYLLHIIYKLKLKLVCILI